MAKLILQKKGDIFIPIKDDNIEIVSTLKNGDLFYSLDFKPKKRIDPESIHKMTFTVMRNGRLHKKYFTMLHAVFRNQDRYEHWDFEMFLREIKVGLGHTNEFINEDGQTWFQLLSISFAKMDNIEFKSFYSRTIDLILARFISGTPEDIERMTLEVLNYA